jgi:hypothetical protein
LLGLSVSGFLAWRSVTVEPADTDQALQRFAQIRARFAGLEPIVLVDAAGRIVRRPNPHGENTRASNLHALAYRVSERRLIHANVPFWFLKAKGPAVQYSLRGTGLDLERLGITPGELQQFGPCLVFDETRANGDRLLVWTE